MASLFLSLLYHPFLRAEEIVIASKSIKEMVNGHLARDGNKTLIKGKSQFRFYAVKWPEIYSYTSGDYQGDPDKEKEMSFRKSPFCTLSDVSFECEVRDFNNKLVVVPMLDGLMVKTYVCRFSQGTCQYVLNDVSVKRWIK